SDSKRPPTIGQRPPPRLRDPQRCDLHVRARDRFERAAAVGLGAVATAAELGHGVVAAGGGRWPGGIRRAGAAGGRGGMPSTARLAAGATPCTSTASKLSDSPNEQERRHRRGRAWTWGQLS